MSMLKIKYNFEQENLFSSPVWSTMMDIDNLPLIENVYKIKENQTPYTGREGLEEEFVWKSDYTKLDSYKPIFKDIFTSLFNIPLKRKIDTVADIAPRFLIIKKGGSTKLTDSCSRANGLVMLYFLKVPENSSTILFKDPRPLVEGNIFFREHYQERYEEFTPIEKQVLIFPAFLENYISTNISDEDFIVFKGELILDKNNNYD